MPKHFALVFLLPIYLKRHKIQQSIKEATKNKSSNVPQSGDSVIDYLWLGSYLWIWPAQKKIFQITKWDCPWAKRAFYLVKTVSCFRIVRRHCLKIKLGQRTRELWYFQWFFNGIVFIMRLIIYLMLKVISSCFLSFLNHRNTRRNEDFSRVSQLVSVSFFLF